jgi:hypothetical protein
MALERAMPRSRAVESFLAERAPDALLLTALTFSRSSAVEQLKAARALGIPTAACVMSWDHLSSKALLHIPPTRTFVWNEVQKHEAADMHGLAPADIVVTGAQCYDQWFERRPRRTREQFCQDVGLDPSRPFVLYVCSAMSPVPDPVEPVFVREWIEALRASGDPLLRTAGVLVRPHPERLREWRGVDLSGMENVVVHGSAPLAGDAKEDYFDSLFFSGAVVGLCTSAFLEAAIVGRPVLTLTLPAYRMHQEGMAHFRYLLTVGGGLLHTAPDLAVHLDQLGAAMRTGGVREARNERFLTEFVRPRGLRAAATPVFLDAVEALGRTGHRVLDAPAAAMPFARRVAAGIAAAASTGAGAWLMMDAIDEERAASERASEGVKRDIEGRRVAYRTEKARRKEELAREREQQQSAKVWRKRLRSFSPRKGLARVKGSLKHLVSARGGTH